MKLCVKCRHLPVVFSTWFLIEHDKLHLETKDMTWRFCRRRTIGTWAVAAAVNRVSAT